ncbi:hypothetical protein DERP_000391 [Dermatophagoides pteronyssinus]|uniref:Uncharacterized protein n=1 Tax=Dermatophagoides pteronyssinus TaxID=6956 RepID=A0ABQ8J005_DERPT|nr:hypothetical protein DERP_000391 [Dermatophagoides pteronyssinus]
MSIVKYVILYPVEMILGSMSKRYILPKESDTPVEESTLHILNATSITLFNNYIKNNGPVKK